MDGITIEQLNTHILHLSTRNQAADIDYYMDFGGSGKATDGDGRNAAHHYAIRGNADGLNKLAQYDISCFEAQDNDGLTPLMYLAQRTSSNVVPYAEERPALLTQTDPKGRTVAGFLAEKGDIKTVAKKLLPLCPAILQQGVPAMVMASTKLQPVEKIKTLRALSAAGFK